MQFAFFAQSLKIHKQKKNGWMGAYKTTLNPSTQVRNYLLFHWWCVVKGARGLTEPSH